MTTAVGPDNVSQVMEDNLASIREWAQDRLDAQQHIPWDSRRYQHLVALIDDMLASRPQPDCRPQLPRPQLCACARRRAGNIVYLDSARPRVRTSS
jgi:hypothetical protein